MPIKFLFKFSKCDFNCPSRVVQRGRQIPIVIFRTLDRGWAVRTCVDIKKKSFVCEYVGEVLALLTFYLCLCPFVLLVKFQFFQNSFESNSLYK